MSRERINVFQLDAPLCEHTFGVSPCTASGAAGSECYNTLKTCQDTENYSETTEAYYFLTESESVYMTGGKVNFPTVQDVKRSAAEINIVSIDPDRAPLGKRESATITLRDIPHHDRGIDPYYSTRSYVADVLTQGTFWTKWQARNDNYDGLTCSVYEGYAGQSLCEMKRYYYVLDRIDGPGSNDLVTVVAKDILKFADNDRVKIPTPSTGKLNADISAVDTTFDLQAVGSPSTAGDDYASVGMLVIGSEVMEFNRTGDTFTVTRAQHGTTAVAHSKGDLVQQCYETADRTVSPVGGKRVDNIIKDMLLNYVGVPTAWIDATAWDTEGDDWISTYTFNTVITKPTGANKLIGELLRDSACYLIPDPLNKKIHFKALAPDPVTSLLNEDDNIILHSFKVVRKPELRLSHLYYWYDIVDVTKSTTSVDNFKRMYVDFSDDVNQVRTPRTKTIISRWLQSANLGEITTTADRIMTRFGREPLEFHFEIDAKDGEGASGLKLGDTCAITHRSYTDVEGSPDPIAMQIISIEEKQRGHKLAIKAQPFEFDFTARLIPPDTMGDWVDETDENREKYLFLTDDDGLMSDGETGPTLT